MRRRVETVLRETGPLARLTLGCAAQLARLVLTGIMLAAAGVESGLFEALLAETHGPFGTDLTLLPYLTAAPDPDRPLRLLVVGLIVAALTVPPAIPGLRASGGRLHWAALRGRRDPAAGLPLDSKRLLAKVCPVAFASPRGSPIFAS